MKFKQRWINKSEDKSLALFLARNIGANRLCHSPTPHSYFMAHLPRTSRIRKVPSKHQEVWYLLRHNMIAGNQTSHLKDHPPRWNDWELHRNKEKPQGHFLGTMHDGSYVVPTCDLLSPQSTRTETLHCQCKQKGRTLGDSYATHAAPLSRGAPRPHIPTAHDLLHSSI